MGKGVNNVVFGSLPGEKNVCVASTKSQQGAGGDGAVIITLLPDCP